MIPLNETCQSLPTRIGEILRRPIRALEYPRFHLDNAIDEHTYDCLLRDFPTSLIAINSDGSGGIEILPGAPIDQRLSNTWRILLEDLRSAELKSQLVKLCYEHALCRYPVWQRPFVYLRLRNPDNYQIRISINSSTGGRYLPPHNDNSYKVLALILYLTDRKDEATDLGTIFYLPSSYKARVQAVRRFNRLGNSKLIRHLPLQLLPMTSCNIHNRSRDKADRDQSERWFEHNFRKDVVVGFRRNRLAGFIKTQDSFHAVDLRSLKNDERRNSLLINLNLKHSRIARFGQFIVARVFRTTT